jgi:hypothetical protein
VDIIERPWELPGPTLATQRLFRARYVGPEAEGSVRLTLRLEAGDRFQLTAVDRLGGRLWALEARGEEGLWVDYRRRTYCPEPEEVQLLEWGPVGDLEAVPRLLLGRLPVVPVVPPPGPVAAPAELNILDAWGRQWTATVGPGGAVEVWALWEGGEASWWWRREGQDAALFQLRGQRELRWREVAAEPFEPALAPLTVPGGYLEECW